MWLKRTTQAITLILNCILRVMAHYLAYANGGTIALMFWDDLHYAKRGISVHVQCTLRIRYRTAIEQRTRLDSCA